MHSAVKRHMCMQPNQTLFLLPNPCNVPSELAILVAVFKSTTMLNTKTQQRRFGLSSMVPELGEREGMHDVQAMFVFARGVHSVPLDSRALRASA